MGPDENVCYCYRVSLRKLVNYARRERPVRASLLSQCLDAGTGCGWCVPILTRIWEDPDGFQLKESAAAYAQRRQDYRDAIAQGDKERHEFS